MKTPNSDSIEEIEKAIGSSLPRRKFLRFGLGFMAAVGLVSTVGGGLLKTSTAKPKKIKMLTPDGKLVEIDASILEKSTSVRASNEDVQKWMLNKPQ